jgi:hypothetical protein
MIDMPGEARDIKQEILLAAGMDKAQPVLKADHKPAARLRLVPRAPRSASG